MYLFLNMFAFVMFGRDVERAFGVARYFLLYFAAVVSVGFVQLFVVTATSGSGIHPTVGASGGVFGILLAFGMLFPRRIVLLLIPPIPLPARWLVVLYGAIELV